MLTGQRPFSGDSSRSVIDHRLHDEPQSLRQVDPSIAPELERICLRCLARWAGDRYSTAADLADDLESLLEEIDDPPHGVSESAPPVVGLRPGRATKRSRSSGDSRTSSSFVPKGLRHYDRNDAESFLVFLPGPVDRHGIPLSITFWKRQIDTFADPTNQKPFDVGVIYGPSGCGKSSFVQAGLIPKLSDRVTVILIEASSQRTERDLLDQLRRRFPELPEDLDLVESLQVLRTAERVRRAGKVLIVIDQFEQWLSQPSNVPSQDSEPELTRAMRQCDGYALQSILLIRDEFWVSITEWMRALDVKMSEHRNQQCVSAFDATHARKVLHLLGAAYQRLPQDPARLTTSQQAFLASAVSDVSEDGRTTCIKLALIAEMLKDQEWVPTTLEQIGGIQGIGVRFLEQQFDDDQAPPNHRRYGKQIESILEAMLPPEGVSIRGQQMSLSNLASAVDQSADSAEFQSLLGILDQETRIITPVDVELSHVEHAMSVSGESAGNDVEQRYQLTHDYLVPSIRQWLRAKRTQTRAGRARLLLKERSLSWNHHPENRRLPSFFELANIELFVRRSDRSEPDRRMLRRAVRYYARRVGTVAAIVVVGFLVATGMLREQDRRTRLDRADSLVRVLTTSPIEAVPLAVSNLHELEAETFEILKREFASSDDPTSRLRIGLALAEFGDLRTEYLASQIPGSDAATTELLIDALNKAPAEAIDVLRKVRNDASTEDERAVYGLAVMDLGDVDSLAQPLAADADPTERSFWICHFEDWSHRWNLVCDHLQHIENPDVRSALVLGLSRCDPKQIPVEARNRILKRTAVDYVRHPSPLVHSSCAKLYAAWGEGLPAVAEKNHPGTDERWYHTPNGLVMIHVEESWERFEVYDPAQRPKSQALWMSDTEITFRLFQRFMDDGDAPERKALRRELNLRDSLTGKPLNTTREDAGSVRLISLDQPIEQVHVEDAILYCNWLSRREGFKSCYTRLPDKLFGEDFSRPGSDPDNPHNINDWELDRDADGYRLPIHAEWWMFRFGRSQQAFPFGSDPKWLEQFSVVSPASATGLTRQQSAPVRSRLPNNFGLFDMSGNAPEWCHFPSKPEHSKTIRLELTTAAYGIAWNVPADSDNYPSSGGLSHVRDLQSFRVVRNALPIVDE